MFTAYFEPLRDKIDHRYFWTVHKCTLRLYLALKTKTKKLIILHPFLREVTFRIRVQVICQARWSIPKGVLTALELTKIAVFGLIYVSLVQVIGQARWSIPKGVLTA